METINSKIQLNAKELILKKINADTNWVDIYTSAFMLGEDLSDIGNFMISPEITELINKFTTNIFDKTDVGTKTMFIEQAIKDASSEHEKALYTELLERVNISEELRIFGKILKINQGMPTKTIDLYKYINSIESFIEGRLNISKIQAFKQASLKLDSFNTVGDIILKLIGNVRAIAGDFSTITPELKTKIAEDVSIQRNISDLNDYKNHPFFAQWIADINKDLLNFVKTAAINGEELGFMDAYNTELKSIKRSFYASMDSIKKNWIKFSFINFLQNPSYQAQLVNQYETVKVKFNILDALVSSPHFSEMQKVLALNSTILNALSKRNNIEANVWQLAKHKNAQGNPALLGSLNDSERKALKTLTEQTLISEWLTVGLDGMYIEYGGQRFDFNSGFDSNKFKNFVESIIIPLLKYNMLKTPNGDSIPTRDNEFVKKLTFGKSKDVPIYKLPFNMTEIDSDESTRLEYEKILNAFGDLRNITLHGGLSITDVFYLYNLIVHNDHFGRNSLTRLFEDLIASKDGEKLLVFKFNEWLEQVDVKRIVDKVLDIWGARIDTNNKNFDSGLNDVERFNSSDKSLEILNSSRTILSNDELRIWNNQGITNPRILVASEHSDPAFHTKLILDVLDGTTSITDWKGDKISGHDVHGLYIITKHDGLPIRKLLETKIPKLIHFSITTLGGTQYEPGVMKYNDLLDRIAEYIKLGLDPNTVTIRIDPIVPGVTNNKDIEEVMRRSAEMGITRIKFSVMDAYTNTVDAMSALGYDFSKYYVRDDSRIINGKPTFHAMKSVLDEISNTMLTLAQKYNLKLSTCAEPLVRPGISSEGCLAVSAVNQMLGTQIEDKGTDNNQYRKLCSCFGGKIDVLKYGDVCNSHCVYCYAKHENDTAMRYYNEDGTLKHNAFTDVYWVPSQSTSKTIKYTPKGKAEQTFTIIGNKIFDKDGKEVSSEKKCYAIFAELALQEKRAVKVEYRNVKYIVNDKGMILSTISNNIMKWPENHSYRLAIIAEAEKKFAELNNTVTDKLDKSIPFYSGGANGSDSAWGMYLRQQGFTITEYTVNDWRNLPADVKAKYEEFYQKVCRFMELDKIWGPDTYGGELTRRDMLQANSASSIFAIGTFDNKGVVTGGTKYATYAAILMKKPVYFFNLNDNLWYQYDYNNNRFVKYNGTPKLISGAAVIGTRDDKSKKGPEALRESGHKAIKDIINNSVDFNTHDGSPVTYINMTFSYNGNARPGIKSTTTFDAIIHGERTATTRYASDGHLSNLMNVKVGDIIEIRDGKGRSIHVRITKPLIKLDINTSAEEWSKKEGWSVEYFNKKVLPRIKAGDAFQIEFEYINPSFNQSNVEVELYKGNWDRATVEAQTDKVFLFGDNTEDRTAKNLFVPRSTQAVIRGLPNAIGIDTKKNRGTSESSYFTDADFDTFKAQVDEAIQRAIDSGKTIVLPEDGIGTGKAQLEQRAPKLFNYLQNRLTALMVLGKRKELEDLFVKHLDGIQLQDGTIISNELTVDFLLEKLDEEAITIGFDNSTDRTDDAEIIEEVVEPETKSDIVLNTEQQTAVDGIVAHINSGNLEPVLLNGKAGTGKTTIIAEILKQVDPKLKIWVGAWTHKASTVLFNKLQNLPQTIEKKTVASMVGLRYNNETQNYEITNSQNSDQVSWPNIIFVDEVSMVSKDHIETLTQLALENNILLIFIGDDGQLPPVKEEPSNVFKLPKRYDLIERVRQGEESPILPYADGYWNYSHNKGSYPSHEVKDIITRLGAIVFSTKNVLKSSETIELFKRAISTKKLDLVKIITFKNNVRTELNNFIHTTIFGNDRWVKGEFIIFTKTFQQDHKIIGENASEWIITHVSEIQTHSVSVGQYKETCNIQYITISDGLRTSTIKVFASNRDELNWKAYWNQALAQIEEMPRSSMDEYKTYKRMKSAAEAALKNMPEIDYAYAITCHKSQGSTYDTVFVTPEIHSSGQTKEFKAQWLYTAITRARNVVTMIHGDGKFTGDVGSLNDDIENNRVRTTDTGAIPAADYAESSPNQLSLFSDDSFHIDTEYIAEREKILRNAPRNSEGKLLAPNGKVSKLTEEQWVTVRTKAFKEWFGDWEKIARSSRFIKAYAHSLTSATNGNLTITEDLFDPDMMPDGASRAIILNGEYIGSIPVINYENKIQISGSFGAASEIEKEYRGRGYGIKSYIILANIAKAEGKTLYSDSSLSDDAVRLWESLVKRGYAEIVKENKGKYSGFNSVQYRMINENLPNVDSIFYGDENVSKVIDHETGEPTVVYHHTDNPNLTEFSTDFDNYFSQFKGGTKKAIFFDENPSGTLNRKYDIPVFLNIRNLTTYVGTKEDLHKKGTDYTTVVNESAARDARFGGLHMSKFDDNKLLNQDVWIIHDEHNVKSATGAHEFTSSPNIYDADPTPVYQTTPSKQSKLIEVVRQANESGIKGLHIVSNSDLINEPIEVRSALGFVRNGEIYINVDKAGDDTVIHEFGHLYLADAKVNNRGAYYALLDKVRNTELWRKMKTWRAYANKIGSDFDEEVLATMIGDYYKHINSTFGQDYEYESLVQEALSLVNQSFMDLINSEILPDLGDTFITNYALQQKIATIKGRLVSDNILKENCQ